MSTYYKKSLTVGVTKRLILECFARHNKLSTGLCKALAFNTNPPFWLFIERFLPPFDCRTADSSGGNSVKAKYRPPRLEHFQL
jgi:hypothetical protein